jgi:hypothetical protein
MHLVVTDIAAARAELLDRGVEVSEPFHFGAEGQTDGLHPERTATARSCPSAIWTATSGSCRRSGSGRRDAEP